MCLSICRQSFLNRSTPSRNRRCSSSVHLPCRLPSYLCFFGLLLASLVWFSSYKVVSCWEDEGWKKFDCGTCIVFVRWSLSVSITGGFFETDRILFCTIPFRVSERPNSDDDFPCARWFSFTLKASFIGWLAVPLTTDKPSSLVSLIGSCICCELTVVAIDCRPAFETILRLRRSDILPTVTWWCEGSYEEPFLTPEKAAAAYSSLGLEYVAGVILRKGWQKPFSSLGLISEMSLDLGLILIRPISSTSRGVCCSYCGIWMLPRTTDFLVGFPVALAEINYCGLLSWS